MRRVGESTSGVAAILLPPLLFCALIVKSTFCAELVIAAASQPEKREPVEKATPLSTFGSVVSVNGPTTLRPFRRSNNDAPSSTNDTGRFEGIEYSLRGGNRKGSGIPLANAQQVAFESAASSDANHGQAQSVKQHFVKFYDDSSGYATELPPEDSHRNTQVFYPTTNSHEHSNIRPSEEIIQPAINIEHHFPPPLHANLPDIEKPIEHDTRTFARPLHPYNYEFSMGPSYYENFKPRPENFDSNAKFPPSLVNPKDVVYLHESSYTRTHALPYHFHHPYIDADVSYYNEPSVVGLVKERRFSPWRKIIHFIAALIPLGLLLTAVTAKAAHIQNASQANVAHSKLNPLKVAQLPLEHKYTDYESNDTCEEEILICRTILEGEMSKSNLLNNMLWNVATKVSEEVARNNGLYEIFNAVKKRNCNLLQCS